MGNLNPMQVLPNMPTALFLVAAALTAFAPIGCTIPPPDEDCATFTNLQPAMDVQRVGERLEARLFMTGTIESVTGGSWSWSADDNYDIVIVDFGAEVSIVILAACDGRDGSREERWQTTFVPPDDGAGWISPTFEQVI